MRHGPTLLQTLAGTFLLTMLAAGARQVASTGKFAADFTGCRSGLKQVAGAIQMYAQDHDDRLPPASRWQEALLPFHREESLYQCPADARKRAPGVGSYAWNLYLDGVAAERVPAPDQQVVLFDADAWRRNATSAGGDYSPRHGEGAHLVFLDGRVAYQGCWFHLQLRPIRGLPVKPRFPEGSAK